MSKLSGQLKGLINDARVQPHTTPAPENAQTLYIQTARDATAKGVGFRAWLCLTAATTVTMNSPDSLLALHATAALLNPPASVYAAELIREVALKCIGFNGKKLAQAHPDLPVHIIEREYGCLFADPPGPRPATVGRVLTSIIAIAVLRAQTGAGPQVVSHIFGLRKAFEDGSFQTEDEESIKGCRWLASNEGCIWLLVMIDCISTVISTGGRTTLKPDTSQRSKL
ncbi:hypothetical protein H2204_014718 [Knufia peltigerae]|uniref:Uncharacterized protein n=1 Tax=Knufia peltigerae TaxID=1002370 RepID=A0AA38XHR8_9EURO|nr:hypothetical protein H2204_014718 [Knufia peltigerae]